MHYLVLLLYTAIFCLYHALLDPVPVNSATIPAVSPDFRIPIHKTTVAVVPDGNEQRTSVRSGPLIEAWRSSSELTEHEPTQHSGANKEVACIEVVRKRKISKCTLY